MAVYEVLTGQTPFALCNASIVIQKVLKGERPGRPEEGKLFTEAIWEILELCWKHKPEERAGARAVLRCLEETPLLPRQSPDAGGIVQTDTSEQLDAAANYSSTFPASSNIPQAHLRSSSWHSRFDGRGRW